MNFSDRLRSIQRQNNSLLCVGLDPVAGNMPASPGNDRHSIITFNREIIKATQDLVCAYKLNLAFYEALGEAGWSIVHRTLSFIPGDIITIGDAKRGDIGNTAALYARSLLDDYGFTATTVNPYMGTDSVAPFISREDRGAFVLAVTSNPGARDIQYLPVRGKPVYEHVVARVKKWNTRNNCGLVAGATKPRELKRIRSLAPGMPLLIPGIGAQGGDLKSAVRFGCDSGGEMALVNAGRSVLYASRGEDFARAARAEALKLRDAINRYREEFF